MTTQTNFVYGEWGRIDKRYFIIPTIFKSDGDIAIASMNGARNGTHFCPAPWSPGDGPKDQISISITKSISNIFKPNFVCLLKNEIYKTYKTGLSFRHLGHTPGVGLEGVHLYMGVGDRQTDG